MTKIDIVLHHLVTHGWIDSTTIRELTNSVCSRNMIDKLKRRRGMAIVSTTVTPTYTVWSLGTSTDSATAK